jgi:hypothetical protein
MEGFVVKYLNGDYVTTIDYSLDYGRSYKWQNAEIFETYDEANEVASLNAPDCKVFKWYVSEDQ